MKGLWYVLSLAQRVREAGGEEVEEARPWVQFDRIYVHGRHLHQIDYIRRYRGFRAPRVATVFTDVNPNYVR